MGGTIIRIDRDGVDLSDPHPSEAYIGKINADVIIRNNAPSAEKFKKRFEKIFLSESMTITGYIKETSHHEHA
jgi:hypothetical protein